MNDSFIFLKVFIVAVMTGIVTIIITVFLIFNSDKTLSYSTNKDIVSAEQVTAEVVDKYNNTSFINKIHVTDYYVKVRYLGMDLTIKSKVLYDSVSVGSCIDVYLITTEDDRKYLRESFN